MKTATKLWNYKVVKYSRGMNGEWFAHKTAATFELFAEAKAYAKAFHADQQATLGASDGHKYCVVPRRNDGDCATYRLCWSTETVAGMD